MRARRLEAVLLLSDREHLKKILNSSLSLTPSGLDTLAKVQRFLKGNTLIEHKSAPVFQKLERPERERLLSELIWRLTCILDASETAVLGAVRYEMGGGFVANQFTKDGDMYLCLAATSPPRTDA